MNIVVIVTVHKVVEKFLFSSIRFYVAMKLYVTGNILITDCDILTLVMYTVFFFDFVSKLN